IELELERVDREISKNENAKKEVTAKIARAMSWVNVTPALAQELAVLTRNHQAAKERYEYLSGKKLTSEVAARVDASDTNEMFKVIDQPQLPQKAIRPNRLRITAVGCVVGILLGFAMMLGREYVDSTLSDEEDAADQLKLPVYTSIPNLSQKRAKKKKAAQPHLSIVPSGGQNAEATSKFSLQLADSKVRSVILDPNTIIAERYQLMRAKLAPLRKQGKLKSLLITSAIPNEGKTFTACCLAGVLAQEPGKKVLLMDSDLRTGNACKVLGLAHRDSFAGLAEVLRRKCSVEEALLQCSDLNLYLLPSGKLVDRPPDLLSSPELELVMDRLGQLFDWIIVDSPPIFALADASIMVPLCDVTVLVVRAEKTPTNLIKDSIDRIGREYMGGVLLNRVRKIKSGRYYTRYYKRGVETRHFTGHGNHGQLLK